MTALKQYQRLETFGIWHASPRDQRRDVIVSLGSATLTISDQKMQALSHWSLPAIVRLNPGERPACFGPGPDMPEVLELDDDMMIGAIDTVQAALAKGRQPPPRLRSVLAAMVVLAAVVALALWLPGALVRQAVSVVPLAQRVGIGQALIAPIARLGGQPCETALGRRALDRLRARLLPDGTGRLVVLPAASRPSLHLPGGLILIDRSLVEDYEDAAVAAGYILAEDEAARQTDPLGRLLGQAGSLAALRLLGTGRLSAAVLEAHAEALVTAPASRPDDASLLARFAAAEVPATPYAYALDITGETTLPLIEADPVAPGQGRPILADEDWVALQGICGE